MAGRALALEGVEAWAKALADYQQAAATAELAGYVPPQVRSVVCFVSLSAYMLRAAACICRDRGARLCLIPGVCAGSQKILS